MRGELLEDICDVLACLAWSRNILTSLAENISSSLICIYNFIVSLAILLYSIFIHTIVMQLSSHRTTRVQNTIVMFFEICDMLPNSFTQQSAVIQSRLRFTSHVSGFSRISQFIDYLHLPSFACPPNPSWTGIWNFIVIDPLLKNISIYPSVNSQGG